VKYTNQFLEYFESFPAFTAKDVKLFMLKNGANGDYYKTFMHNMVKSGRAYAIGRGRYTLHDDPMVAGFAFSPFYYGMETALTYYKLWNYMTPISIVTMNRIRKGSIELLGRNATVRRIQKNKFFGYSMVNYKDNLYIPMADMEKTLVDSVYFHSRFSLEVYSEMAKRIDRKRLDSYLRRYSGIVKKQVYGIIKFSALSKELATHLKKRGIKQKGVSNAVRWAKSR
jgi:predicted transcriptional regulator of viral defense system